MCVFWGGGAVGVGGLRCVGEGICGVVVCFGFGRARGLAVCRQQCVCVSS